MRNKKGFTLVEVIISIAALGIICAVLLRLFVVAGNTNDRAADMQKAELCAASTVEVLAGAETLSDALGELGIDCPDYLTSETFEYTRDGYKVVIDVEENGDYPGTLYSLSVSAYSEDDKLAGITTAKYYKEGAHD